MDKEYYILNRKKYLEYFKKYNEKNKGTPIRRARILLSRYNQKDKKSNRGKGNLTSKWIVENIFSKPCVYCGKTGWEVIGCNIIDNSLPHTMDNVEPCCFECNMKVSGGRPKKGDK